MVVVCASAFHYFEHPLEALVESKRVLKPGGKVVIRVSSISRGCSTTIQAATTVRFGLVWGLMVATATKD